MRLVADESVEAFIAEALRTAGHEVYEIAAETPGIRDSAVLDIATMRGDVLLTDDKDFGELVFHRNQQHRGVVLMRLYGMKPHDKAARMVMVFGLHAHELPDAITTVGPRSIRIRKRI
jgi:predicted nuclease of predicted toxin-antitoxin system